VIAAQARRGICGDHAHADAPAGIHALAHGDNFSNQLVAKMAGGWIIFAW